MALAGGTHVVVARQPQFHRPSRLPGEHGRDAGDDGRLTLLAAERTAHPSDLDGDGVERQTEQMRDPVLNFGRMLGRAPDLHVASVAGGRERNLSLEIEMVLAATAQFAGEPVGRGRERGLDLATNHDLRRRDIACARDRLFDRQHGGKRLVVDLDELRRCARLIERRRRDCRNRLAFILDHLGRQCRLIAADRRDVVPAGDIGGGDGRDHAGRGESARQIDMPDARVPMRAQHQGGLERSRHVRDVVEVSRLAGDVPDRAVVAHRCMRAAANASKGLVHSVSTRIGPAWDVSSWKRRSRPAAARRR